jgi:antitoxin component YwqK of YwqJK toxin-antitoxin module
MDKNNYYKNGQKISVQTGEILTYYYKSGKMKAQGKCINENFEGKWIFYNEDGTIRQEGNFKENNKDGDWKRYNKKGEIEYYVEFKDGKQIKKNK